MRSQDAHLEPEELERLLELSRERDLQAVVLQSDALDEAFRHIEECQVCRATYESHKAATALIQSLDSASSSASRESECPPESVWYEVVLGNAEESSALLLHAAECNHCGALLREISAAFSPTVTPAEEVVLNGLESSQGAWQRTLANTLSFSKSAQSSPLPKKLAREHWWQVRVSPWAFAGTLGAIILTVISLLVLRSRQDEISQVTTMLNQAYAEDRTTELRFAGAPYGSWNEFKGPGEERPHRGSLTNLALAEFLVIRNLEKNPDNPGWLQLKARTELIKGHNPESFIGFLERAHDLRPNDTSIQLDLAIALFERSDREKKPRFVDLEKSAELLSSIIAKDPNNTSAIFDRAIVFERLALYRQAEKDWKRFLELDSTSQWADEARTKLGRLRELMGNSSHNSPLSLDSPDRVAQLLAGRDEKSIDTIDARIELYLAQAIDSWLPNAFPVSRADADLVGKSRAGLNALAGLLAKKHGDKWLSDLLKEGASDKKFPVTVSWISESQKATLAGDDDRGRILAHKSAIAFLQSKNAAGFIFATWEELYATRLSLKGKECFSMSNRLWTQARESQYQWLRARILLDQAQCAYSNSRVEDAFRSDELSLGISKQYGFTDLYLRAIKDSGEILGRTSGSAALTVNVIAGLRLFWSSPVSSMSGYNLYSALDYDAEFQELWFLDSFILREALQLVESDPDTSMRAAEEMRLAKAFLMSNDTKDATEHLTRARKLIVSMPSGEAKNLKIADIGIAVAAIDILEGRPSDAATGLENTRDQILKAENGDLAYDFFSTYGQALRDIGEKAKAEAALSQALQIAQNIFHYLSDPRERLIWSRRVEPACRTLVRVTLDHDPVKAFALWEDFKALSLDQDLSHRQYVHPTRNSEASFSAPTYLSNSTEFIGSDVALLSYAVFSDGLGIWVYDTTGVRFRWIPVSRHILEVAIRQFRRQCADPSSDIGSLRVQGAKLYEYLWNPLNDLLGVRDAFVIEPDELLETLPFSALVDKQGKFLAEKANLSFSAGLLYLHVPNENSKLHVQSHALVVADQSSHPGMDLPRLPDTELEARLVAGIFKNSTVLRGEESDIATLEKELPEAKLFHFSGHAVVDANTSRLIIGTEQNGGVGVLGAEQIQRIRLKNTRLVVLSACSTAEGPAGVFSDSDSVARSFISAGVGQVVASRWPVESQATAQLMDTFYRSILDGRGISRALTQAQVQLLRRKDRSHPFYWAAFSVFGNV